MLLFLLLLLTLQLQVVVEVANYQVGIDQREEEREVY
jgi:hypothetical protein